MESSEANIKVTTRSTGIRYGILLAAIGIVFFIVLSVMNVGTQSPVRYLSWLFSAIIIFMAHKYFKEEGDGYMTIGQGVGIGFWTGLISSLISGPFTYVYIKFFDTNFLQIVKDQQVEAMQGQGMSAEQIDQAMQIAGMFTSAEAILIYALIFGPLGALVIGLIVSLFTQKKNPQAIV